MGFVKPEGAEKLKNYVALILDKSGSMDGEMKDVAIKEFNEQLDLIEENVEKYGIDTKMILVEFNHEVTFKDFNVDVDKATRLTPENYSPSGMTAMRDAMGMTIQRMRIELPDIDDKDVSVLFVIVTDGMENQSKEFDWGQLKKLIEEMKGTDRWTFTYLGCGHDVMEVATKSGLDGGSVMCFAASVAGYASGSSATKRGISDYYGERSRGRKSVKKFFRGK